MPTILKIGRYRFHFYSDERTEPPHIHVECGEGECKFWLQPIRLASNRGLPAHELRKVERLIFENWQLLETKYNEHHPR